MISKLLANTFEQNWNGTYTFKLISNLIDNLGLDYQEIRKMNVST